MQFGIFSVSDITRDPVTDRTPSEAERIDAILRIAQRADEVGLDVFAIGEHHNPPFFSPSPTTLLAHIAALTERIILSTAVTLVTTNDPVKIAEDYAMLQHLSKGRMDLMLGRGNTSSPSSSTPASDIGSPTAPGRAISTSSPATPPARPGPRPTSTSTPR